MTTTRTNTWGGARAGAGRPRSRAIASQPHKTRPHLSSRHPVLVAARVTSALAPLGRRHAHAALRSALRTTLARSDFRIVEVSIRRSRVELLVEANDKVALARGMQGFQVAAARRLNTLLRRRGAVFPDRYRPRTLATRAAVRAVLATLVTRRFADDATAATWPETWLLRIELGRVRARPRWSG